jgi:hypothetical protein
MVNKSMTSNWALPTNIIQYSEEGAGDAHVSWQEVNGFSSLKSDDGKSIKTSSDLVHIAREPRHDITQKTYFLRITGFDFVNLPAVLSGIEMKLTMNRFGRITDDTVQLCINNTLVGENMATLDLNPIKIYGSRADMWDSNLTISDVLNSSFGITLRFKSHPRWPHKSSAMIDSVQVRVY